MPKTEELKDKIHRFLLLQNWPVTTEDISKEFKISWQTAQINLWKLVAEGKAKYKKVGRQNQWRAKR